MNVIGIDPGPETSGMVFATIVGDEITVYSSNKAAPNDQILRFLRGMERDGFKQTAWTGVNYAGVDAVAIETPAAIYAPVVGAETINTIRFAGRLEERSGDRARLYSPAAIRQHICGTTKAKDAGVRQALIDRFGKPGTKKAPGPTYGISSHAWRALAAAVVAADASQGGARADTPESNHDASETTLS